MNTSLTTEQQTMLAMWQQHAHAEFVLKSPDAALATMTDNPYVICVPSGAGGEGRKGVREFYANRFIPNIPADIELNPISQTFGHDQLVEEMIVRFTHSLRMDWMLPGLPQTGCKVEFLLVVVMGFDGGKLASEHIYWDQATVLSQLGVLDMPAAVGGIDSATKLGRLAARKSDGLQRQRARKP
jgi:carboxymethylenebutenolidase